jgi:hypothetical protein
LVPVALIKMAGVRQVKVLIMKDVRVDGDGEFRCWNCGNKGLLAKRTFRSKVLIGVGALLTKKKLKCQTCGEYNDTGNAKPYTGPEDRKWRKRWEKDQAAKSASQREAEDNAARAAAQALIAELALAQAQGLTGDEDDEGTDSDTAQITPAGVGTVPPPPPASVTPAGWYQDPYGRHDLRYFDGKVWTVHVSTAGVKQEDPVE